MHDAHKAGSGRVRQIETAVTHTLRPGTDHIINAVLKRAQDGAGVLQGGGRVERPQHRRLGGAVIVEVDCPIFGEAGYEREHLGVLEQFVVLLPAAAVPRVVGFDDSSDMDERFAAQIVGQGQHLAEYGRDIRGFQNQMIEVGAL